MWNMHSLRYTLGIMILLGISLQETYAFTSSSKHAMLSQIPTFTAVRLRNHPPSSSSSVVRWSSSEKVSMDTTQQPQQQQPAWNHRLQMVMSQMKQKMEKIIMIPKRRRQIQKKVSTIFAILTLCFSTMFSMPHTALASSGGRMGGSFKSSPSRSYSSSPSRSSSRSSYYGSSTRLYGRTRTAPVIVSPSYRRTSSGITIVRAPNPIVGYVVPIALYGSIIYFNNRNRKDRDFINGDSSALGPGISVVSMSVGLDVYNRDDPTCILARLKRLSEESDTQSRSGVQNLVSEVCLELIRQQINIFAASTSYQYYTNEAEASRGFNSLSIKERSKFERETVNKFGGVDRSLSLEEDNEYDDGESTDVESDDDESRRTSAIVTIILSIEGNKTHPRERMNSWQDVWDGLHLLSADAKVEDCLLSAEILWTPEDRSDVLTRRDIAADYPELRII